MFFCYPYVSALIDGKRTISYRVNKSLLHVFPNFQVSPEPTGAVISNITQRIETDEWKT